jgi:hypothetical protein
LIPLLTYISFHRTVPLKGQNHKDFLTSVLFIDLLYMVAGFEAVTILIITVFAKIGKSMCTSQFASEQTPRGHN